MRFKSWLLTELANSPIKAIVDDAVQQIWKVIYIPEHPEIPVTEAVVEWEDVNDLFTVTSRTPFYQWVETYCPSFEPGKRPDKLARGQMGTAAFFGNSVLKFTQQSSEAEIAALLGQHDIPEVAIMDVVKISRKGIYCIAQERVNTTKIPDDLITASWIVGDYIADIHYPDKKSPFKGSNVKNTSQDAISKYSNQANSFVVHAYVEMILDVISRIEKKTGRVYNDMGAGNIGLKGQKPALFDLGGNYITRRRTVPRIKEI